ncbi:DUF7696 family protein [Bradyrhizobium sp. 613_E4_N2_2]|uniref:DUF7696 family protein n=1 Tax=Bradyrhizobium sp. 613_E4_N2_2 TaxID=3240371 RepID=UPI003F89F646
MNRRSIFDGVTMVNVCTNNGERHDVTLHDGRVVSNYSAEWRLEVEARWVCRLRDRWARMNYIRDIEKRRGKDAAEKLKLRVYAVWQSMKAERDLNNGFEGY